MEQHYINNSYKVLKREEGQLMVHEGRIRKINKEEKEDIVVRYVKVCTYELYVE